MATRENASLLGGAMALTPRAAIATNTTTVGTVVPLAGFNSATFFISSGVITDGTYVPLVEEADTSGGTYTPVVDADLTVTEASITFLATDDSLTKKIGYIGVKPFVRLSLVSTGVTTGGFFSALAVLGDANFAPVA